MSRMSKAEESYSIAVERALSILEALRSVFGDDAFRDQPQT